MARVAIVTDSTADLPAEFVAAHGIRVAPLYVTFGDRQFRSGVDLTLDEFWDRMLAPDAPFPTTAAASPGGFVAAFREAFDAGAEAVVCVTVGSRISGTFKSAEVARAEIAGREVHVVDSASASMGVGLLVVLACELADAGSPAADIAATLRSRVADVDLFVALDTLDYLRKGGRLSAARAAIGTVLSVKPIITLRDGLVEIVDKPRTRARARERVIELLIARPVERIAFLHTRTPGIDAFRDEVVLRLPGGVDPDRISTVLVGPSIGPHVGPGILGAVVLRRPA